MGKAFGCGRTWAWAALWVGVAACGPAQAVVAPAPASYSGLYVFGDSLSDAGNVFAFSGATVPLSPPYFEGRFSNGPNYADLLAQQLGLTQNPIGLNPSLTPQAGGLFPYGSNYAWGGALTGAAVIPSPGLVTPPIYRATLPGAGELPSQLQMFALASGGAADPNALYVLWGGGNDLRDAVQFAHGQPQLSFSAGEQVVNAAIANLQSSLATLSLLGARHVLVPNVPDIGLTPEAKAWDDNPAFSLGSYATALTGYFNLRLSSMLQTFESGASPLDVMPFDTYGLMHDMAAHPGSYGLTNATDPCLQTGANSIYIGGAVCASPASMLYWDNHHPSATVHAVLAQQMAMAVGAVPEPSPAWLLMLGLVLLSWRRAAALARPASRPATITRK
jgi:phospholipase/lecithinase/hemolysin